MAGMTSRARATHPRSRDWWPRAARRSAPLPAARPASQFAYPPGGTGIAPVAGPSAHSESDCGHRRLLPSRHGLRSCAPSGIVPYVLADWNLAKVGPTPVRANRPGRPLPRPPRPAMPGSPPDYLGGGAHEHRLASCRLASSHYTDGSSQSAALGTSATPSARRRVPLASLAAHLDPVRRSSLVPRSISKSSQ